MVASETRSEGIARELLQIRGWNTARPPKGNLLWKNEYRDYPALEEILASSSKAGAGRGYPDFLLIDPERELPLIVGETKAARKDIDLASHEAEGYAKAFCKRGIDVLAVGVAGSEENAVDVRVEKRENGHWKAVSFQKSPIQWLPTPDETKRLLLDPTLFCLDPEIPPAHVLAEKAEEINRIFRDCAIRDPIRPRVAAAFILGLWQTRGHIRMHPEHILEDINSGCKKAFREAGKAEIEESITIDIANETLATQAPRIIRILNLLRVTMLTGAHDYLGQLYEHFFRYVGGNSIGQFFTPRHITSFMAELCQVTEKSFVVDPACGTGGFLISSMYRMIGNRQLSIDQVHDLVRGRLWGFESEPQTAALCVANMILRGDGTTGVINGDCFLDRRYPIGKANIVLGNPPFPHKGKSGHQPEEFVDRALEALQDRGEAAMIVPASLLTKSGSKLDWRRSITKQNTISAIIKLPNELFQPYASAYTNILILKKGIPHRPNASVFFGRIENDGYRIKKTVRVEQPGEQLTAILDAYRKSAEKPGWHSMRPVDNKDWSPGEYIESAKPSDADIKSEIQTMLRSDASMHSVYADKLVNLYRKLDSERLKTHLYSETRRKPFTLEDEPEHLAHYFNIYYGLKALHNKENLEPGDTLVVSSTGEYNGCYGFFDFKHLIRPPFATVPATGSIGMSFVQRLPCAVSDDCLLLFPKEGVPPEALYVAAAVIRMERWRFSYGRKITADRIARFKFPRSAKLIAWVRQHTLSTERLCRDVAETLGGAPFTQDLFRELADEWMRGRPRGADVARMVMHPAYQRIIGMGLKVVPMLLQELQEKPGHWFWALHAITGANPVLPQDEGKIGRMAEAWIKWGREQGYVTSLG